MPSHATTSLLEPLRLPFAAPPARCAQRLTAPPLDPPGADGRARAPLRLARGGCGVREQEATLAELGVVPWHSCPAGRPLVGLYAMHLAAWRRHFPREQLLVVRTEDFHTDPSAFVARLWDHVGLAPDAAALARATAMEAPRPEVENEFSKRAFGGAPRAPRAAPMLPRTRALLDEFYREYMDIADWVS